ncbi:hypothetical protein RFI_27672 [Reticulomyxa filosa]|uniref:Uncharacterized protein n=1 Tax=Reticulomyxa filosa TaxID=46433 RepID=X6M7T0_RETFI|nr:hypothetical protein RFI_27672 [Reticulomyxa filosa]|eukprot:ETO09706.1 hypothetical protein RFI_27672 [Reticulomyxa filosa]
MTYKTTKLTATDVFLTGLNVVYLSAFSSLYTQIPGLFGENGILPVHRRMSEHQKPCFEMSLKELYKEASLFCVSHDLKLTPSSTMELFCVLGMAASIANIASEKMRITWGFFTHALLWLLYLSIFNIGNEVFLSFQWDILLLEVGFLSIFINAFQGQYSTNNSIFF